MTTKNTGTTSLACNHKKNTNTMQMNIMRMMLVKTEHDDDNHYVDDEHVDIMRTMMITAMPSKCNKPSRLM